jgi:hypothetical protein
MHRNRAQKPEESKSEKSLLVPVILTISAVAHCALLGWAALSPAVAEPASPTARVQVQVYQHDEAQDAWSVLGARWALVSRDKLAP